ncbi:MULTISPECIES: NAD-dependent epimerase/dehydratase family protein [unclassified Novosphingobium]|uniref:NAD-dependent epimerase/dehydratase family protein n=1 Tax=unclassified Novosphingobium TaxID=2644732 RepID=UPI000A71F1CA|nr:MULTISPECIES: NAD-dependent epimerase/dehydratase family protein [unclassified Novosphingobium]MBB3357731.1 dihydroflavonol-4-reductase [Novosphingobium sp. BK256]MBB3373605.1 dihydroflavonol-4-reductase [Novosphingobium sp. BK280]MBB3378017.1 dihydroflavonol-4-reductase [Novosphingobium sp. BK258]MBB3420198.1 dihydroflavonol-4-reductase [Novosphingobium sp. BK267]MBB3447480.1 dihydroflavonol-4-reductase [Novosphingobium sp. BK352]
MDKIGGTVLVTGGSGYIAGYIIRALLDEGWTVNTTVRDLAREAQLRAQLGGSYATLRFFKADLMDDKGWRAAMDGCSHVCHVASPITVQAPRQEDELILPAREGALRALRFARAAGVERFVQTSSVAAIVYGHGKGIRRFTEADWTDTDGPGVHAYAKSKTLAERAAREWIAREGRGMEFVSINPSVVLGPVWGEDYSTSIELVRQLLAGAVPGCADLGFGVVDVRDVAALHVRALTEPGIDGERFIASGPFLKMIDIARILRQQLGQQARRVPLRHVPDWMVHALALVNPMVRQVTGELGNVRDTDAGHALSRLGWATRPVEQTIADCAQSLIETRVVAA